MERIKQIVEGHRVVLFMKGTRRAPECGFSASVVDVLDELLDAYTTVDVLADPELREGVKAFSSWPTLPQLYVQGKLVGGADIVKEMHRDGELAKLLGTTPREVKAPGITITDGAARALREATGEPDEGPLHLRVTSRFEYDLYFGPREAGDVEASSNGVTVLFDGSSARRADGIVIDFVERPGGGGFKIDNPNEPARVQPLGPKELAEMMAKRTRFTLVDVRTPEEIETASLEGAIALDDRGQAHLDKLDRTTPVVFMCHHGVRSRRAAEHYLSQGFRHVYNLEGGIDAWSLEVDPKVSRY